MGRKTANAKQAEQLNADAEKIEARMQDVGTDLQKTLQEQRNFLQWGNRRRATLYARLEGLEVRLKPYTDEKQAPDNEFEKMKTQYMDCIAELDELQKTLGMVEESIAEAETLMPGGVSTEQPVMGPNFGRPEEVNRA